MEEKFKSLVEGSDRVLVTSHISPDPDAVSSVLLVGRTLLENYPGKDFFLVLEEEPLSDLGFLEGYDLLRFTDVSEALESFKPELLIIVDANNYDRVSRNDGQKIRSHLSNDNSGIKTVIIDHHELDGLDEPNVLINNKRPATAEEVYVLLFEKLGFKKPVNFAETALLGIISDTQRHRFDHPGYRETYRITAELLDEGASIEKLESRLENYTKDELAAVSHLASNITDSGKGYSYSYIGNDFLREWQAADKSAADLKNAVEIFVNKFIRSFEGNKWGFIIYPDLIAGPGCWGVSLRSLSGVQDVAAIAKELGGGGHKPAAGAKVSAGSVQEVLVKVQNAIQKMS